MESINRLAEKRYICPSLLIQSKSGRYTHYSLPKYFHLFSGDNDQRLLRSAPLIVGFRAELLPLRPRGNRVTQTSPNGLPSPSRPLCSRDTLRSWTALSLFPGPDKLEADARKQPPPLVCWAFGPDRENQSLSTR
ncbi:hypothetical protein NPIL_197071 [Nephila pilipes]|uniref:Uncharacterized protein n=1 Tax=Nephila pilipes TaxID=299642 RepID=A0A8X6PMH1_NEPPI|nr:hypothetical protein NPIL_197071 [Nephila pilipes]